MLGDTVIERLGIPVGKLSHAVLFFSFQIIPTF